MGIVAAVPALIGIVRAVQGLFGKGNGEKKKAAALAIAAAKGIEGVEVPDWLEVAVGILNSLGAKDPSVPVGGSVDLVPGKTYPVTIEIVSWTDGKIEAQLRIG